MRLVLIVCLAIAFFSVAYPMYVIRPFRAQGVEELAVALVVRSWAPLLATLAAVIGVVAAVIAWRRSQGIFSRLLVVAGAALTAVFGALSYFNVYEKMFHRIDAPESIAAAEAKVDADDMVLAIRVGGQARAYPIRMMAYHHIANDWVGGQPVVSTY